MCAKKASIQEYERIAQFLSQFLIIHPPSRKDTNVFTIHELSGKLETNVFYFAYTHNTLPSNDTMRLLILI